MLKLLNLGCGDRFLKDWVNVDFIAHSKDVLPHNLLTSLPFETNSFDVAYSSHVLEHFSKNDAVNFIAEIYRVLKPGGILRIVVPDLERFVTGYLNCLNRLRENTSEVSQANYDWSVVELLDQMVREESGGEMAKYWSRENIINADYITERLGHEFTKFRQSDFRNNVSTIDAQNKIPFKEKIKYKLLRKFFDTTITPNDIAYLKFRKTGESHKWMYDEVSLKQLLAAQKFKDVSVMDAKTSAIPSWQNHILLDMENNNVRKPDSLFMEGKK